MATRSPVPDPEVPAKVTRRRFTAVEKARILDAYESASPIERAALCRRERIYSSLLYKWRSQRASGKPMSARRGRKPNPEAVDGTRANKQIAELEKKLAKAEQVIDIQGKVYALLRACAGARPRRSSRPSLKVSPFVTTASRPRSIAQSLPSLPTRTEVWLQFRCGLLPGRSAARFSDSLPQHALLLACVAARARIYKLPPRLSPRTPHISSPTVFMPRAFSLYSSSASLCAHTAAFQQVRRQPREIDRFWAVLAFLSNSLVFLLLGLRISFARILHEPVLVLLTLGLVLGSRFVLTYVGLHLLGINNRNWKRVVMLAGMRGALSLALAVVLPTTIPFRPQIIDAVFGVVAVTLIVQGLAIGRSCAGCFQQLIRICRRKGESRRGFAVFGC